MRARSTVIIVGLAATLLVALAGWRFGKAQFVTRCDVLTHDVVADGRWHPVARLWQRHGAGVDPQRVQLRGADHAAWKLRSIENGGVSVLYRAPVLSGVAHLRLQEGDRTWPIELRSAVSLNDSVGDGLPDALRLHDAEDRERFRQWFTALAEHAAALPEAQLPPEVTDCSALLRWSYRLSLVRHDDRWYKQFAPGQMPALPSVEQWNYPETPLGAGLFRISAPGATPKPADFAQFADAKTLYTLNSFRLSRDVRLARPGDLLFFHQLEQGQQYHSMIVTGEGGAWVVYHTGPEHASASGGARKGEMRRARISELLQHPDPRWHPSQNNPNFLGVYRWNLLRDD